MCYCFLAMKYAPIFVLSLLVLGAGCANKTEPIITETPNLQSHLSVPASQPTSQQEETQPSPSMPQNNLSFSGVLPEDQTNVNVRIKTTKGDVVIELLPKEGPNAASNFVYLIGQKYYDGIGFHRYVPDFVIQGGDPTGTGRGGPGYTFKDDPVTPPERNPYVKLQNGTYVYLKGTVAMANAGPDTNGSQFFIMNADAPMVGPDYSVFGHVIEGIEVVEALRAGDVMESVTIEPRS